MNDREFCIVFRALGYTDKLISQLRPDANLILEAEDRLLCGYTRLYDIRVTTLPAKAGSFPGYARPTGPR